MEEYNNSIAPPSTHPLECVHKFCLFVCLLFEQHGNYVLFYITVKYVHVKEWLKSLYKKQAYWLIQNVVYVPYVCR